MIHRLWQNKAESHVKRVELTENHVFIDDSRLDVEGHWRTNYVVLDWSEARKLAEYIIGEDT